MKSHRPTAVKSIVLLIMILIGMGLSVPAMAFDELVHPGYIDNVAEERHQVTREVVIVPPSNPEITSIVGKIFTQKMSKEFSKEFRDRFGYTEFEQLEFTSNRFVEASQTGRLTPVDEYVEKQEAFGQYIAKELTEYHVDNYLKSTPTTRAVYKAKEAISNVEVATKSGYKFKMRYKLTSNRLSFKYTKPDEKFHQQIDTSLGGNETTVRLSYDVTTSVLVGSDYTLENQVLSLRGEKRLTETLTTSIVGQSFPEDVGDTPAQERVLLGLTWND